MKHIKKYFGIMLVIGLSSIIPFYITLAAIKSDPIQYCHEFENEVCSYDFLSIIALFGVTFVLCLEHTDSGTHTKYLT